MKKILSFILILTMVLTMVLTMTTAYAVETVKDVTQVTELIDIEKHWAKDNIEKLIDLGIINGYPNGTFKPDNTLTFDEFIKMIIVAMGYTPNDSDSTYWADGYIAKAEQLKIVDKTIVKDYRLELTREQVARIVGNTLCITESRPSSSFAAHIKNAIYDYHLISDKYKQDVIDVYAWGILQGNDTGEVEPKDSTTRAEATTVIFRMMDKTKRLPVKFDEVKSISGYNADGEFATLVAPVLDKKPVNEMIDVAYILQNQIINSKGAEKFFVANIGVGLNGYETLTKQEFCTAQNKTQSQFIESTYYTDFYFNVDFIDFKGKHRPYELMLWKRQGTVDDMKYQYQWDKYAEYFMEYYKEPFYEMFKLLFEDKVDTAWDYFVTALKNQDVDNTIIEMSLNDRRLFINYDNSAINMVISLKGQK